MIALFTENQEDPFKSNSSLMFVYRKSIPNYIFEQLTIEDFNLMARAHVGYMLSIYSHSDVCNLLAPISLRVKDRNNNNLRPLWANLRHKMMDNYATSLGIKVMLMRCTARKMSGRNPKLSQEIDQCNLMQNDAALFKNLKDLRLNDLLEIRLANIEDGKIPNIKELNWLCNYYMTELNDYVNKFVNYKLWFVFHYNNMQMMDFANDIRISTIKAFHHRCIWQPPAHLKNTLKMTIRNSGMKIIEYYNSPERVRLMTDSEGKNYTRILTAPEDKTTNDENYEDYDFINIANISDVADAEDWSIRPKTDDYLAIKQYLEDSTKIQHRIVSMLYMVDNPIFCVSAIAV